jgi:uncharacterized protein (DUF1501 family)
MRQAVINSCECAESISRRSFLKTSAILTFAALPDLSFGAEVGNGRLLVILLRGGMDGLFAMPPVGDPSLKGRRLHLMPDGLLTLDGTFALHPSLTNVHEIYQKGEALLVHGVSYPYTGRSHFEGQDIMETGILPGYSSPTGWLGRALDVTGYQALAMSLPLPLILRGKAQAESRYPSWISRPPAGVYEQLGELWLADVHMASVGRQLAAGTTSPAGMEMALGIGQEADLASLAQTAGSRLRAADGPRVAVLDHVGFDTHSGQPGQHSQKLRDVDQAIGAFRLAIGDAWKETLVVTVTEFGRTVAENGSWGTDHGWGTCVFVLGGALRKGGVVADWPGLKKKDLFEGRDLKATIDARSLYAAMVSTTLGIDPERVRRDVLDSPQDNRFEPFLG